MDKEIKENYFYMIFGILSDLDYFDEGIDEPGYYSYSIEWAHMTGIVKRLIELEEINKIEPVYIPLYQRLKNTFEENKVKIQQLKLDNPFSA